MKILIITVPAFNPYEMWPVIKHIKDRGHQPVLASSRRAVKEADVDNPRAFKVNYLFEEIHNVQDFGGVVCISGDGLFTRHLWRDVHAQRVIDLFAKEDKVIASICMAVPLIRYAAVGRKVSYFPSQKPRQLLEEAGAIPVEHGYMVDGNIVTAEATFVETWIESAVNMMEGKDPIEMNLSPHDYEPKGAPRKPIKALELAKQASDPDYVIEEPRDGLWAGEKAREVLEDFEVEVVNEPTD